MRTVEAIVANKFPRVFIQFAYVAINCLLTDVKKSKKYSFFVLSLRPRDVF